MISNDSSNSVPPGDALGRNSPPRSVEPAARASMAPGETPITSHSGELPPHDVDGSVESQAPSVDEGVAAPAPTDEETKPLPVEGDGYRVHLDRFDGPLDLLLYLIRENEVDVVDIPIAKITEQYLESIHEVESLDLDRAGEYLLMAATLMRIKSKMLIPRDEEDEDEETEDPRAELVRRLLEYREFKRASEDLGGREEEWRGIFRRAAAPLPEFESEEVEDLGISLLELCRAFQKVLDEADRVGPLQMDTEEYAVDEQMDVIRGECTRRAEGVPFLEIFSHRRSRTFLITTFLALLELLRQREVTAEQVARFGEIWIKRHQEAATAHES